MKAWTPEELGRLARGFQPACVLAAGAELGVFGLLTKRPLGAREAAARLQCDERGTTVLLDALAALGLLVKRRGRYSQAPGAGLLAQGGGLLWTVRHLANCMRRWTCLAETVRSGKPPRREPSILGEAKDAASFIGAMHEINAAVADELVGGLRLAPLRRLLDVGGGSGTWTLAFLRAHPKALATLFDLPKVIPLARERAGRAGLMSRLSLVPGDFEKDPLPKGFDLAWASAIAHQNSRTQNRALFRKVRAALRPGGRILIRDMVMEESRTSPAAGALFAVNMLVGTEGGSTYTFSEFKADLQAAGFGRVRLLRRDPGMNSVVSAARL